MTHESTDSTTVFSDPTLVESWLPAFSSVVAVTRNTAAVMSETGAYARVARPGDPWTCEPHRITLRVGPEAVAEVHAVTSDDRTPPAVRLVNATGALVHSTYVTSRDDVDRLSTLVLTAPLVPPVPRPPHLVGPSMSRRASCGAELRAECARLCEAATSDHVDLVLVDGGRTRRQVLSRVGRTMADRIHTDLALHSLVHLRAMDVPLTLAVPSSGLMQVCAGTIDALHEVGGQVSVGVGCATVTLDVDHLAEAWVVRPEHGPATLELYDHDGSCVLVVTTTGPLDPVDAARWDHVLEMLCIS